MYAVCKLCDLNPTRDFLSSLGPNVLHSPLSLFHISYHAQDFLLRLEKAVTEQAIVSFVQDYMFVVRYQDTFVFLVIL